MTVTKEQALEAVKYLVQALGVDNSTSAATLRQFIEQSASQDSGQAPAIQDVMWEVFYYSRIMDGFESLEGDARDARRAEALAQDGKIRAMLAALAGASPTPQPELTDERRLAALDAVPAVKHNLSVLLATNDDLQGGKRSITTIGEQVARAIEREVRSMLSAGQQSEQKSDDGVAVAPAAPRKATNAEVAEWAERHDLRGSAMDLRAAFEDAESHHLTRGVPPSDGGQQ